MNASDNAISDGVSLKAAALALAGIESVITPDEVIKAIGEVSRVMFEQLRETATGGLASLPQESELCRDSSANCKLLLVIRRRLVWRILRRR